MSSYFAIFNPIIHIEVFSMGDHHFTHNFLFSYNWNTLTRVIGILYMNQAIIHTLKNIHRLFFLLSLLGLYLQKYNFISFVSKIVKNKGLNFLPFLCFSFGVQPIKDWPTYQLRSSDLLPPIILHPSLWSHVFIPDPFRPAGLII